MTANAQPTGLALIRDEMRRQHGDALASFACAADVAAEIAKNLRQTDGLRVAVASLWP